MVALPRFYATVPKDPVANRLWRREMLLEGAGSSRARQYLWDACTDDTLFYFNSFVWTFNPRLRDGMKVLPFITFPMQDHAIREIEAAIDAPRDLVIYKSRDTGASWMCLGVFEKRWHFFDDNTFLCLSRNEAAVNQYDNEDSLFPKIDRMHARMPAWMMPRGWNPRKHRNELSFFNPQTGSTINGCATAGDAAVGGRRTAILLDEFSRVEEGYEIDLGTADVSDCRIFNFTAYGKNNAAYAMLQNEYKKKICLHWSGDPRKNAKLYRWDGDSQRFRYYVWNDEKNEIEECGPHEYGPEDADTRNFDPPGRPFEPVRDGVLRSPIYDMEDTRRNSRKYMAINWDIDFTGSDDRVYDIKMVHDYARDLAVPVVWEGDVLVDQAAGDLIDIVEKEGGPLRLWFNPLDGWPKSEKGFACGADVAKGVKASNSCASFADIDTCRKVAELVTPYDVPETFAAKVLALCKLLLSYGGSPAFLAFERIGPGEDFMKTVLDLGYSHLYYDGVAPGEEVPKGRKPGWMPTRTSKRNLHGEYEMALRQRRFLNPSKLALQELENFVETSEGIQYQSGGAGRWVGSDDEDASGANENHGDRGTADAICNRAVKVCGGGSVSELAKESKGVDPLDMPWTLAGRVKLAQRMDRQRQEDWNWG